SVLARTARDEDHSEDQGGEPSPSSDLRSFHRPLQPNGPDPAAIFDRSRLPCPASKGHPPAASTPAPTTADPPAVASGSYERADFPSMSSRRGGPPASTSSSR